MIRINISGGYCVSECSLPISYPLIRENLWIGGKINEKFVVSTGVLNYLSRISSTS